MKTKTKTLKGWVNMSSYIFSENSENTTFLDNLKSYIKTDLQGFKKLQSYETMRGKAATEKVIVKGWYWRGSWSDPTKETVCIFYK